MGSGQLHAQAPAAAGDVSSDCWKRRQGNLQVLPEGVEEQLAGLAKYSVLVANAACDALAQGFAPGPGALMVWLAAGQQLASCDRGVAATYLRAGPTLFTIFNSLEPWTSQVLTMSKRARAAGIIQAYLAALAGVVQKQGKDFAERWWELGQALAEHDIAQAVDYFRRDPQMTLGHADVRDLAALLDEVRRVHRQAPVALQAFFGGALRVLADTGPAGLSAWTGEGLARAGEGAAELRRFFSLQDPESQAIVRRLAPGYAWRQRARYHRLALQAWLEVAPELVEDDGRDGDAQRNPGVRPGPGNRLYLPALFKSQEHAWLALLHAAGHLRFGMPVVARPGRVAESNGAVSAPQLAQDGTETATVARIVDLCEDLRVDLRIGEQVPGYWARICRYCEQQGLSDGSPGAYQRLYLEQLGHALHGELLQVPFDKLQSPDSNPQSSADMALRLADGRWLPELAPDEIAASYLPVHGPNWCNTPEAANLPGAEAQATPPQHGRQGSRRREAQSLPVPDIQPQRKPRPGRQAKDAPVAAPEGGSGGRSQAGAGSQPAISNSAESQGTEQPACRLPEWDCRENRYRLDWVQVFERSPRELDHARAMALLQEHAGVQRRIRRIVQSQKPTRMAHLRRQPDGDDLDLDAAVAYVPAKNVAVA
jgi:nitric oxide reductase NorD protein